MIVTEVGRHLLATADRVIEAVELAEEDISRKISGERGELKVGTQCIFCYKWLPQVMHLFHGKFPRVEIAVGNSTDLTGELEGKTYDMVISGAVSPEETQSSVPLFQDQLVCIMKADHPLAAAGFIQLDDFHSDNLEALKSWPIVARPITPRGLPLTWHAVYLTHANIPIYQQEFIRSISRLNVTEQSMAPGRPPLSLPVNL